MSVAEKKDAWKYIEIRMGKAMARVGPSLTLSQGSNFVGMMVGRSDCATCS